MAGIFNKKTFKIIFVVTLTYVGIKFILPLVWPFIFAMIFASWIHKPVEYFSEKLKWPKVLATLFLVSVATLFVFGITVFAGNMIFYQLTDVVKKIPELEKSAIIAGEKLCSKFENKFGISSGTFFYKVSEKLGEMSRTLENEATEYIMKNSAHFFTVAAEGLAVSFIIMLSTFIMTMDYRKIERIIPKDRKQDMTNNNNKLGRTVVNLKTVLKAYLKAQVIILFITTFICIIGIKLSGNKYAFLLGMIIGILDMLPMIGAGIVLVPWGIISLIMGKTKAGIILFIVFAICYVVREVLEPMIIGENSGISPLASVVSIFIGYKLFGLAGVILGPIAYVFIRCMVDETFQSDL